MQGRRDIPLSERGRAQVLSWRLPADLSVAARVSSPLRRAVETAELLGGSVELENALIEMDWGAWEGETLADLREIHASEYERNEALGLDFRPPGGESPRDVRDRVQTWLARTATNPEPIVAVTHLGVLRVMLAAATGWDMTGKPPIRLRNDAVHRFAVDAHGQVSIAECNVPLTPGEARALS
jgi:probable phosphoglycerate mutase